MEVAYVKLNRKQYTKKLQVILLVACVINGGPMITIPNDGSYATNKCLIWFHVTCQWLEGKGPNNFVCISCGDDI